MEGHPAKAGHPSTTYHTCIPRRRQPVPEQVPFRLAGGDNQFRSKFRSGLQAATTSSGASSVPACRRRQPVPEQVPFRLAGGDNQFRSKFRSGLQAATAAFFTAYLQKRLCVHKAVKKRGSPRGESPRLLSRQPP